MAYSRIADRASQASAFTQPWAVMAAFAAHLMARRRAAATRKALQELTTDQLEDIGLDERPRPRLVIKAGLITNLSSMR